MVLNILCDLICDGINYCASSFGMVKVSVYDEIVIKKTENGEKIEFEEMFYMKLDLNDDLGVEFIAY